jgi:hypothetical protein
MRQLLVSEGFEPKRATYVNTLLFWAAVPHRFLSRLRGREQSDVRPVAPFMNTLFAAALKLEARLLGRLSFPFGLSVVALAKKK